MVLVTGATGILGRVIVLELLRRGKNVRAAKRPASNLEEVRNSWKFYVNSHEELFAQIEWVDVDFNDITSMEHSLLGVEEVYHCAAKVSFHPDKAKEMYDTNIKGTQNLLYAIEGRDVKKFCHISSIAVLDGFNENGEMDENSDYNPKLDHSAYAISKHFSEMEVWRASAEGLNTVILNPGMIIGTGNWQQSSGELFGTFQKNSFIGSGGVSYVDVRDVASAAVELMERNIFGERFIAISENWKYEEFGNSVRKKLGLKPLTVVPSSLLQAGRLLNMMFGWMIPLLKMANKVNIQSISTFNIVSNKKIRDTLGITFIPVEESIRFHLNNYISDQKNPADFTSI